MSSQPSSGSGERGYDRTLDAHLNHLNGAAVPGSTNGPRNRTSQGRFSQGRHASFTSAASANSRKSLQNVTDSLHIAGITEQIDDTTTSIRALEQEIQRVQKRQSLSHPQTSAGNKNNHDSFATSDNHEHGENEEDPFGEGRKDSFLMYRHSRPRNYKPYFTLSFLAVCVVMLFIEIGVNSWSVEKLKFNPLIGPSAEVLIKMGAKVTELLQEGQAWRLITPIFLHVGIIHLLVNMLSLVAIGVPMEQEFGTVRVAIIAILSGIFGVIMSAILAPFTVGVGASGAIFGLFGAGWADLIQNWQTYAGKNIKMLRQLAICTIINFLFGLMPFVDNYAHLGGFLVGAVTGSVILVKKYGEFKPRKGVQIACRALSALVLPIAIAVMLFLLFARFDLAEECGFCTFMTCVPFPPRKDPAERWWDCTPCLNGFGSFKNFTQGGTVEIVCPIEKDEPTAETIILNVPDDLTLEDFTQNFQGYCRASCELA